MRRRAVFHPITGKRGAAGLVLLLATCCATPAGAEAAADTATGPRIALLTSCPRTATRTLLTVDPTGLLRYFRDPDEAGNPPPTPDRWKRVSQAERAQLADAIPKAQRQVVPDQDQQPRHGARPIPDACDHTLAVSVDGSPTEFRYGVSSQTAPPVRELIRTIQAMLDGHSWKTGNPQVAGLAAPREVPGFELRRTFHCTLPPHSGVESVDAFGVARLFTIQGRGATPGARTTNAVKRLPEADLEELVALLRRAQFASIPASERTPDPHRSRVYDACSNTLEIRLDGQSATFKYEVADRAAPALRALIEGIFEILGRYEYREGFF
jgi:hypothetical protein